MIWLTWRHYRWLFAFGILALAVVILLFVLNAHAINVASQQPQYAYCFHKNNIPCRIVVFPGMTTQMWESLVDQTFPLLPFVVGCFLGAPLLAREYEQRTHLFAWTQSVSRTRWLSSRLLMIGGAVFLGFGVLSCVTTWWSFIQDYSVITHPWSTFMMRGSVFVANMLFSLMFGITVGALIRRTQLAMIVTLLLLIPIQMAIATWYPSLFPPSSQLDYGWKIEHGEVVGYDDNPQDLIVSRGMVGADGKTPVDALYNPCPDDRLTGEALRECNKKSFHTIVWYHRFSEHFWPLQLVTTALLLALAALCTGMTYWQVQR
jgi:hypothetical protein